MRFSEKKICIVTVAFEHLLCTTPLQEKGDRLEEGAYDQQVLSESILAFFWHMNFFIIIMALQQLQFFHNYCYLLSSLTKLRVYSTVHYLQYPNI